MRVSFDASTGGWPREGRLHPVLLPAVAGVAGCVLVLLVAGGGRLGLTPDSVGYVAAARNLLAGRGFTWFSGEITVCPTYSTENLL